MYIKKTISVGNLLLDLNNYRHGKRANQKDARDAIIAKQGKKLVNLAQDIVNHGLNPFDLVMVIDTNDGNENFTVLEGNRRLTAVNLLLNPSLAEGTPIHKSFVKLATAHPDAIPKVLDCVVAPNKDTARIWINRKHSNGLEGAGTEQWDSIAKARSDVDAGIKRPDLDVVDFVLSNPDIDDRLRYTLENGDFNLTTLQKLVQTKELQDAASFDLKNGKLVAKSDKKWLQKLLTQTVKIVAEGKDGAKKFTERTIHTPELREVFVSGLMDANPGKKLLQTPWQIAGSPVSKPAASSAAASKSKSTASTDEQSALIPKKFKLELPSGKINDIFVELKLLDATKFRHSVSVLFRVFIEFSLDNYIREHALQLPLDNQGKPQDTLSNKLKFVKAHLKTTGGMTTKEMKSVDVLTSDVNQLLAPNTLNAFVHSPWMNPDPLALKLAWANLQLFIERIWTIKSGAGQA